MSRYVSSLLRVRFGDHFGAKLGNAATDQMERPPATGGEVISFSRALSAGGIGSSFEPTQALHALQHRIQGAGANLISTLAQFLEDRLAADGFLPRVVQDAHLPEAQQDFPV